MGRLDADTSGLLLLTDDGQVRPARLQRTTTFPAILSTSVYCSGSGNRSLLARYQYEWSAPRRHPFSILPIVLSQSTSGDVSSMIALRRGALMVMRDYLSPPRRWRRRRRRRRRQFLHAVTSPKREKPKVPWTCVFVIKHTHTYISGFIISGDVSLRQSERSPKRRALLARERREGRDGEVAD